MWGERLARQMFRDAGFGEVEVKRVAGDPTDIYYIPLCARICNLSRENAGV
jgi:Zn-dependent membrane protease YugP